MSDSTNTDLELRASVGASGGKFTIFGAAQLVRVRASTPPDLQSQVLASLCDPLALLSLDEDPALEGKQPVDPVDSVGGIDVVIDPEPPSPRLVDVSAWPKLASQTEITCPISFLALGPVPDSKGDLGEAVLDWTNRPEPEVFQPLAPWSRIVARLRSKLSQVAQGNTLDVAKAVERMAKLQDQRDLPRRTRRRWGQPLQLIIDTSNRLIPYFDDQSYVINSLIRQLGFENVDMYKTDVPIESQFRGPSSPQERARPYQPCAANSLVLVLGDLGVLGHPNSTLPERWRAFGQRIRDRGGVPVALVPCDPRRVASATADVFDVCAWTGLPGTALDAPTRERIVETIVTCLSFLIRVEPGLIRAVRNLIPGADDPTLDSEVWQHPAFQYHAVTAGTLYSTPEIAMRVRAFERFPVELRRAVLDVVRRWRANGQCVIYFEELSRLSVETRQLVAADWNEAVAGFDYLRQQVLRKEAARHKPVTNYAERLVGRVFVQTELNPDVGWIVGELRREMDETGSGGKRGPSLPQRITLFQSGRELVLRGEDDSVVEPPDQPLWSRLVSLRTRSAIVEIRSSATAAPDRIAVPAGGGASLSPNDQTDVNPDDTPIANSSETPNTATSELFQEVAVASRAEIRIAAPTGAGWSVRTDLEEYRFAGSKLPTGAEALGRDRYGMWMDQELAGELVRWRWIPPGRFLMGSPLDEPGRFENEGPQHWVTLTQGFWMMETPCTQRIWSAIMKKNPSTYKVPDHPVENVSWKDVGLFLKEIHRRVPNSKLALPTEAQWEYACRAGSNTAVYRTACTSGKIEDKDSWRTKASSLDSIAWYFENAGRGTKPVKGKAPNSWGLYDMLGNVWEWCADGQRQYVDRDESDPVGSDIGSRCVRGGGWGNHARDVRCAYRLQDESEFRSEALGFRLVRVQDGS